jgi:hypothetical protein
MKDILIDIEDLLRQGFKPMTIAGMLHIPISMVYDVEESLMQLANPRFYGPDYD